MAGSTFELVTIVNDVDRSVRLIFGQVDDRGYGKVVIHAGEQELTGSYSCYGPQGTVAVFYPSTQMLTNEAYSAEYGLLYWNKFWYKRVE